MQGFIGDIEKLAKENNNFRKVIYTGRYMQLVLMSLKPGEEIGEEIHGVDQFLRIEEGEGRAIIGDKEYKIKDDMAILVPAGLKHNIVNTGNEDLKLYTIYALPHHKDGIIHQTREEAIKFEEHFDGKTTE
jgi:mannose-6-phosphate isomerase-like protein (cupin superfamily)